MGAFTRTGERGFTYLGLLFFVAITAAALAALGQMWSTAAQREREAELEFRGTEIAHAIHRYVQASQAPAAPGLPGLPGQPQAPGAQYPRSLDELLVDSRGPKPRHHLRRAYVDPFTGEADWVLIPATGAPGRFMGVHSRSEAPLLRTVLPDGSTAGKASGWVFLAQPEGAAPPAAAASDAASAPASATAPLR